MGHFSVNIGDSLVARPTWFKALLSRSATASRREGRIPMMARLIVTAIILAASSFGTAFAKSADPLQGLAKHMVRSIDFDLCLPADAIEYEASGKPEVIQLVTSPARAPQLPMK